MNRKNWKKTIKGSLEGNNDGNDFYYTWIDFHSDTHSIEDLFEEFLGVKLCKRTKVIVKGGDGLLFFEVVKE